MPWTAKTAKKHNKCGGKAWARRANAILRDSGDEGKAIRIANWMQKGGHKRKKRKGQKIPMRAIR